jgi:hypothetical protein
VENQAERVAVEQAAGRHVHRTTRTTEEGFVMDKWQGWAFAGGMLMMVVGIFKAVSGVIGLFNDEWIVRGFDGYFFVDLSALSWWYIIVGVILLLAGWAVLVGRTWGKWVGMFALGVAIISELAWVPIYPVWSILLIVLYVLIIYGLFVAAPLKAIEE